MHIIKSNINILNILLFNFNKTNSIFIKNIIIKLLKKYFYVIVIRVILLAIKHNKKLLEYISQLFKIF